MSAAKKASLGSAMSWMFGVSLLLFWLPVAGPLLAGLVGGQKAGSVGRAITAVLLPGFILGIVLFMEATFFTGIPLIGFIAGFGGLALAFAHIGPLLVGAILGACLSAGGDNSQKCFN